MKNTTSKTRKLLFGSCNSLGNIGKDSGPDSRRLHEIEGPATRVEWVDAGAVQTCRSSGKVPVRPGRSGANLARLPPASDSAAALLPPPSAGAHAVLARQDKEILAMLLWLYRRLSRGYGQQEVIERPIEALARRVGLDITDSLAERGPALAAAGAL